MIRCIICHELSPLDAKFCIGCGKPIKSNPYIDGTKRLSENIEIDGKIYGPYIEYGSTPHKISKKGD